ncbi:hypothetical protein M011DRAFT_8492 [Sporormia fimetaria CBS 119925]|uniref:RRM domain-containing protein n=1 Tax=Sporormia fimetaria CBS 119925 TaxID=1340428 RepID=A0A6A6VNW7_9PLEO|nr:hypothetical protein M011DRAFT_8492 [Sporormia fimetaria CBS 119925]
MAPTTTAEKDYMLIVTGTAQYPHHPILQNWETFKDKIRGLVRGQPGWTEVVQNQGWSRFSSMREAQNAYAYFARSGTMLVHLFSTSRSNKNYNLLICNCSEHFTNVEQGGHSAHSGFHARGASELHPRNQSATIMQPSPSANPYGSTMGYTYYPSPFQPMLGVPQAVPRYAPSHTGIPVNVSRGAALTEARGIFIRNISYSAKDKHLAELLRHLAYHPIEVKLHKNRKGTCKGYATAKFSNGAQAQDAVRRLNGLKHLGMTLEVRLDTEKTVVVPDYQGPLVVDGSGLRVC